jgi:hypothetical protein
MNSSGMSLGCVLLIVFLVLKLTGLIHWSWLWVLSPLWIGLIIVIVAVICAMIVGAIVAAIKQ